MELGAEADPGTKQNSDRRRERVGCSGKRDSRGGCRSAWGKEGVRCPLNPDSQPLKTEVSSKKRTGYKVRKKGT